MKKYIVISYDDGTVHDKRMIEILNKYNVRATFNLNSGLDDYVWYYQDKIKIERLTLKDNVELYKNHEVASHTLTHPYLTDLSKEELIFQINQDIENLSKTFNRKISSFAVPFTSYTEREIDIIKEHCNVTNARVSQFKKIDDFSLPIDPYHIGINALGNLDDVFERLDAFDKYNGTSLFVIAGHSYDFHVENKWNHLEKLLNHILKMKNVEIVTMEEAVKILFKE